MDYKVKVKGNVTKVIADDVDGWNSHVKNKALLKLKDTENGYIAKFPSYSSMHQDNYICLNYAEAHELLFALVEQTGMFNDDEEIDYLISRLKRHKSDKSESEETL